MLTKRPVVCGPQKQVQSCYFQTFSNMLLTRKHQTNTETHKKNPPKLHKNKKKQPTYQHNIAKSCQVTMKPSLARFSGLLASPAPASASSGASALRGAARGTGGSGEAPAATSASDVARCAAPEASASLRTSVDILRHLRYATNGEKLIVEIS
jgi:hypothetical protein